MAPPSTFAVLLLMAVGFANAEITHLQWSDCGSDPTVSLQKIEVTPMPVQLPGPMQLTVQAAFGRSIDRVQVELSVKRETFIINLPIPCLMHLGSCTYESSCSGTNMLDTMIAENWAGITTDIGNQIKTMVQSIPGLNVTACPIPPATINLQQYTINLPAMPSILSFFAAGDYEAHAVVRDKDSGDTLLCLDLELTIKEKEEPCTGIFCG